MPAKPIHRIYALIHTGDQPSSRDNAALQTAAFLAETYGKEFHALVLADRDHGTLLTSQAAAAGASTVSLIESKDATNDIQTYQLANVLAHALQQHAVSTTGKLEECLVLVSAGTLAEEAAGMMAAQLGAVPLGRPAHIGFGDDGVLKVVRSGFGGRLSVTQQLLQGPAVAAVRAPEGAARSLDGTIPAVSSADASATETISLPPSPLPAPFRCVRGTENDTEINLEGASLIVSGGRGMSNEAGFTLLRELAGKLNAATGASLPAVDAGWAPVSRQIGQSGKYVSPVIYLAIGISGTPQHLAGIDPHATIIAVNKDADASIFQVAHTGVVAEWETLLPAMLECIASQAQGAGA